MAGTCLIFTTKKQVPAQKSETKIPIQNTGM